MLVELYKVKLFHSDHHSCLLPILNGLSFAQTLLVRLSNFTLWVVITPP